jgi:hypothetical protein
MMTDLIEKVLSKKGVVFVELEKVVCMAMDGNTARTI